MPGLRGKTDYPPDDTEHATIALGVPAEEFDVTQAELDAVEAKADQGIADASDAADDAADVAADLASEIATPTHSHA